MDARVDNRYHALIVAAGFNGRPEALLRRTVSGLELPCFEMASEQGPHALPHAINAQLRDLYGRDVRVLTCLAFQKRPDGKSYEALMALDDQSPQTLGPGWVRQADLRDVTFAVEGHAEAARQWLAQTDAPQPLRAPWTVPGWFDEVSEWIGERLADLGSAQTGPIEQVRSWSISCLLRVPAAGGDYYLKAVPPLFAREPALTRALDQRYPGQVPEIAAVDQQRNWLLLRAFGGQTLRFDSDPAIWEAALRGYARLQIDSLDMLDELRAAGCADRGLDNLAGEIDNLLADEALLMVDQPRGLSAEDLAALRRLALALRAACEELASCGIPHTLEHGDLHGGNVSVTAQGFIYYDWTDGCLAFPLVCLTTFLEGVDAAWHARLRAAYMQEWASFAPPARMKRALALVDVLGPLHMAVSYRDILAAIEPRLRWEFGGALGYFLREVLKHQANLAPD